LEVRERKYQEDGKIRHKQELHKLYSSRTAIRVLKWRMRWVERVALTGEMRSHVLLCETSGSHGGEYEVDCLLGCCDV
jgi:hypothetical protein